jgi:putative polyhydroxyalkanoate system protein
MAKMGGSLATIDITRQHQLGLEGGKQAVGSVATQLKSDLNATYHWSGNQLKFQCPGAEGHIDVAADRVRVTVDLSWLLRPAKGRIEQSIQDYLRQYLG